MASINSNASNDIEMEPLFLVCDCGEAFDSISTANDHVSVTPPNADGDHGSFTILPESEAM